VVQTFQSLGVLHAMTSTARRRHPDRAVDPARPAPGFLGPHFPAGGRPAGPPQGNGHQLARIRLEVCLARNAKAVLATSSEQMTKLAGLGVPRASIRVVPWGVDTGRFAPEGPVAKRNGRPRLLAVRQSADEQGWTPLSAP
jgi:hypothetical protein